MVAYEPRDLHNQGKNSSHLDYPLGECLNRATSEGEEVAAACSGRCANRRAKRSGGWEIRERGYADNRIQPCSLLPYRSGAGRRSPTPLASPFKLLHYKGDCIQFNFAITNAQTLYVWCLGFLVKHHTHRIYGTKISHEIYATGLRSAPLGNGRGQKYIAGEKGQAGQGFVART